MAVLERPQRSPANHFSEIPMKYLRHSLVLCFGVLALTGCPGGDDDDDSSGPDRGDADGGVDDSAAGKGAAGRGGASAGRGASEGGKGGITGDQAAMGVCEMMGEMGAAGAAATQCTGIEEYTQCTEENCGSADCYDGACKDLLDCYQAASDPCKADCEQSDDCTACLSAVARCAGDECIQLIMCGETESGGACDQLDDCCDSLADAQKMACETAAEASRSGGGDQLCMSILTNLCPE
jgi:hypothetical protein